MTTESMRANFCSNSKTFKVLALETFPYSIKLITNTVTDLLTPSVYKISMPKWTLKPILLEPKRYPRSPILGGGDTKCRL